MKVKNNIRMIMVILLSLSIFTIPALGMKISSPVKVNETLVVSDIPAGSDVFFILNEGVPIFARADSNGTARFLPLVPGTLKINVMKNGDLIDSLALNISTGITAGPAVINQTLTVSNIPPGSDVFFILNDGVPIFARAGSDGTARFLPLVLGTLKINVMQKSILIDSLTLEVLETSTSTRSSSSGRRSTGVNSREPVNNVARFEIQENDIITGTVKYLFSIPDIGIYELIVSGRQIESRVTIRIESLIGTSKLVTENAPGNIYKNLDIWLGSSNINQILIRFKVDNSWISSNSFENSDINLFKWDSGKWLSLVTKEINKDGRYTYFESDGTGGTMFAIGAGATPTSMISQPLQTETETPKIPETGPTETIETAKPTSAKTPGFGLVLAMIAIFLMYVGKMGRFGKMRRKK